MFRFLEALTTRLEQVPTISLQPRSLQAEPFKAILARRALAAKIHSEIQPVEVPYEILSPRQSKAQLALLAAKDPLFRARF